MLFSPCPESCRVTASEPLFRRFLSGAWGRSNLDEPVAFEDLLEVGLEKSSTVFGGAEVSIDLHMVMDCRACL